MLTHLDFWFKMVINLTSLRDNMQNVEFFCFLCKSFANRDYSALIFNYEKVHRISKFSIKPFRTISIRYLSVFLLNLKLTIMFNWKYIFVSTGLFWSALICFALFALFLIFFSFGYFRKCMARSEKLVYNYYGLWLGKPSPGQKWILTSDSYYKKEQPGKF